jgi:hypothetical protein
MTQVRRRVKHKLSFEERLKEEARQFRAEAEKLPPDSKARELLLQRVRQAETALQITNWLQSPGQQAPKQVIELGGKQ